MLLVFLGVHLMMMFKCVCELPRWLVGLGAVPLFLVVPVFWQSCKIVSPFWVLLGFFFLVIIFCSLWTFLSLSLFYVPNSSLLNPHPKNPYSTFLFSLSSSSYFFVL